MFDFKDLVWRVTRGTGGVITLKPTSGTFNVDDDVKVNVYVKKKLNEAPVLSKTGVVASDGSKVTIELSNNEMEIGEIQEKKVDYWYEIKDNGSTLIGWDSNGPKRLELYPEGSKD